MSLTVTDNADLCINVFTKCPLILGYNKINKK